ncbi:hypothetical protein HHI36_022555 [Cryptolaemus montrouzieri]|uniref:Uncharacterized protein n=1 Tax=Cryptolaemus montrouzieri TaxID=559131 RepID=A0ABD2N070_9CUCU
MDNPVSSALNISSSQNFARKLGQILLCHPVTSLCSTDIDSPAIFKTMKFGKNGLYNNDSPRSCSIDAETLSLPARVKIRRCSLEGKEESSCFAIEPRVLKTDGCLSPSTYREPIFAGSLTIIMRINFAV